MSRGAVSVTARRVAAFRLAFERLETDYGQPTADEALARDVADGESPDLGGAMAHYLRGRTAFFDRVVVNALQREVTQVVSLGAGYDGRAWRYAKDGVRWWEVDQADTQATCPTWPGGGQRERAKIHGGAVQVRSTLSESRPPGPVDRA